MSDNKMAVGTAGLAALITVNFTHPIDVIKIRKQVTNNSSILNITKQIVRKEGISVIFGEDCKLPGYENL